MYQLPCVQVVRSIDTLVIVVIPMTVIFVMNAAIGVKICRYTGRTVDRPASPSVVAAAAAAAAGRRLGTGASNSADDLYSNCSTVQKCQMRIIRPGPAAEDGANASVVQPKRHNLYVSSVEGGAHAVPTLLRTPSPCPTSAGHSPAPRPSSTSTAAAAARSWRVLTRRHQTQLRITKALLIVSTVFVALNLPSYAFRIHAFVIELRNEPYDMSLHAFIWQEFIQFLYYSNFSSRFFLYSACSTNFRQALVRLICRRHNVFARCP